MAKVLYISSNPKAEHNSYSLSIGRAFIDSYKQVKPQDEIVELELFKMNIPLIDLDVFTGWDKLSQGTSLESLNAQEQIKIQRINFLCDQFAQADKYIFVTPMWNLSVPPLMKAYIDCICVAGKTFKYTDNGPVGLLKNKHAIHIQARGGVYSQGPAAHLELGDRLIRSILNFLGVTDVTSLVIEGIALKPNEAPAIKAKALQEAHRLGVEFANKIID